MVTILPPDKWDLIIDFLAPDVASPSPHYDTLRATALTCQAWLPRARFRLYKHVELYGLKRIALFARTLTQSPDLQALVHRLHFWFNVDEFEAAPVKIPFPTSLIPTLSALHGLLFTYSSDGQDHLAMIQHRFREKWMIHKSLRTLRLDDVDITFEDLTRCVWSFPLLEELTLFRTYWREGGTTPDSHGYPGHCQNLRKVKVSDHHLRGEACLRIRHVPFHATARRCHFGERDITRAWHVDPGSLSVTDLELSSVRGKLRRYESTEFTHDWTHLLTWYMLHSDCGSTRITAYSTPI